MSTVDLIRERLAPLNPGHVEIKDDSASHAGHAGARDGGGHFFLTVVSEAFEGQPTLARHRKIYELMGDLMHSKIHALSIQAKTPEEFF